VALLFYTQDIEVLMHQCQQKNAEILFMRQEAIFGTGFSFRRVRLFFSTARLPWQCGSQA
jgi:hypothetical protein